MAASYADRLQAVYPAGPYKLLGWSLGGVVAHELAIELQPRGCVVERLVLLDDAFSANRVIARNQAFRRESNPRTHLANQSYRYSRTVGASYLPAGGGVNSPTTRAVEFALPPKQLLEFMVQSVTANQLYLQEHVPDVFDGDMVIFSAARSGNENDSSHLQSWRPYVAGDITTHSVDCTHHEMLTTASLSMYGEQLKLSLEA